MQTPVTDQLLEKLYAVGFCQLLRCLQSETASRIGLERDLSKQHVQLSVELDPHFPTNELSSWTPSSTGSRPILAVQFFGLYGSTGALPHHYTQLIVERIRDKDHTFREFLDIFNHRLLCLFYRAWEKYAFPVAFETARRVGAEDPTTMALWGIIGNRLPASRHRLSLNDDTLLYYGGIFAASGRPTAQSLRAMVQDFTGIATEVKPLVGQWLVLQLEDRTRIGSPPRGASLGNRLGIDTIVGERIWDVESRLCVMLGPVTWEHFNKYLPDQRASQILSDLVRRYLGPQWDVDLCVIPRRDQVRGARLAPSFGPRLGWNTWLGQWTRPHDPHDAVFAAREASPAPVTSARSLARAKVESLPAETAP